MRHAPCQVNEYSTAILRIFLRSCIQCGMSLSLETLVKGLRLMGQDTKGLENAMKIMKAFDGQKQLDEQGLVQLLGVLRPEMSALLGFLQQIQKENEPPPDKGPEVQYNHF